MVIQLFKKKNYVKFFLVLLDRHHRKKHLLKYFLLFNANILLPLKSSVSYNLVL